MSAPVSRTRRRRDFDARASCPCHDEEMKGLVLTGIERVEPQELPSPAPGEGEVLLRVSLAGICGSDISGFLGHSPRRKPAVLATSRPRQPRCGRGRSGKRGISPAKPKHCRGVGRGRHCHAIRHGSRRQSLHGDCAAGGSRFVDDLAAQGTGRALGWSPTKGPPGPLAPNYFKYKMFYGRHSGMAR